MRKIVDMSKNSGSKDNMELFICIVKESRLLDDILTGFVELGITGASIIDARGMGQILAAEVPIFAGFKNLLPGGNIGNHMILSVMPSERVPEVMDLVEEVMGSFAKSGTGIMFSLPLSKVRGLAPEMK